MIYFIPKFKKIVILNTQFLALKYRIPIIKYPEIPYAQKALAVVTTILLFWVNFSLKSLLSGFTYAQNVPDKL